MMVLGIVSQTHEELKTHSDTGEEEARDSILLNTSYCMPRIRVPGVSTDLIDILLAGGGARAL